MLPCSLTMGRIYDFWLGERVSDTQRFRLRHRRDGLCHDCKRNAVLSGRCRAHYQINLQKSHEHYMQRKAQATNQNC